MPPCPSESGELSADSRGKAPLAQQIGEVCTAIAASTHHRILTVVGGLSYTPQINKLKHGVDILIATPGRLVGQAEFVELLHMSLFSVSVRHGCR